jgi:hypothetical protein
MNCPYDNFHQMSNGFNAYFLHLIHFFNPEILRMSRFSVYMVNATLRYQQALTILIPISLPMIGTVA